ncbi:Ras-related protein Rab-5C [Halotydeus destructor]|nr:Ras-related protein Rab-5C [Halotydeus destructor]
MALKTCTLKVVVIGESEVGKTSLLLRMTDNVFFNVLQRTADIELKEVTRIIDDIEVKMNIFDTVGTDRYRAVSNNYYRDADAALLVYDVNRRDSLTALDYWSSELDRYSGNPRVIKVLVGNKLDLVPLNLQPAVQFQVSSLWAASRSIGDVMQTSAKSGHNVANAFEAVIRLTSKFQDVENGKIVKPSPNDSIRPEDDDRPEKSSSWCCL